MPALIRYVQDSPHFPDAADVVIIGAGISGSAAAWELTRKGLRVVIIEKGLVGAEQSSRNWGWCRQQNRDERELPLIIHALQRWQELNEETGEELGFRRSGLVYATRDPAEIAAWENWGKMARHYDVRSHILNAAGAKALTPGSTTDWLGVSIHPMMAMQTRRRPPRGWWWRHNGRALWCFSNVRYAVWIFLPVKSAV